MLSNRFQTIVWDVAYYITVVVYQLIRLRRPSQLLKANYGIDHGGFAFASKYSIQEYVGHEFFPETMFVSKDLSNEEKKRCIVDFAEQHGYPVILKPDSGYVGKGVCKIDSAKAVTAALEHLQVDYLVQAFIPGDCEFGLFYVRLGGEVTIPSINQKIYPAVIGDGIHTVRELALQRPDYAEVWDTYLQVIDDSEIPQKGRKRILSFIGSNTLGSAFVDVTDLSTSLLAARLHTMFKNAPGVNFGRLDVKAASTDAFLRGEFMTIEVNGVASLPTNMMDSSKSFMDLVKIMHRHAQLLVTVSNEHRTKQMNILGLVPFIARNRKLMATVESQHTKISG